MSINITSPIEGYSERSTIGPVTLDFADGVATVDELSRPLRAWLETKGYKVETVDQGPFDPSQHKADEVLAYLEQVDTSDEYDRVTAAEREGKARKGLLEAFDKAEADRISTAAGLPGHSDAAGDGQNDSAGDGGGSL